MRPTQVRFGYPVQQAHGCGAPGRRPAPWGRSGPQLTYVHATDEDLLQGAKTLARIHKIA